MSSLSMTPQKSGWRERLKTVRQWLEFEDKEKWVADMKGSLGLTASIIATMTFQLATSPPGGVVQASLDDAVGWSNSTKSNICSSNSTEKKICVGQAILAVTKKNTYLPFLVCNTTSFVASLGVILILVSGIPLDHHHQLTIWLLSIGMCITVTSLALTYMFAASMVTPNSIWPSNVVDNGFNVVLVVWASIAVIVGTFHMAVFIRSMIKWILKLF